MQMSEFLPINLCNVIYKVIAKALANHLRLVHGGVVSESQGTFIPGKLISDNAIIGFECLDAIRFMKRKIGSFTLKLDMSKAYDCVEWRFLANMMRKLGFLDNLVTKMMHCVSLVSFFFLINGEVCGKLKPSRGLRQGDSLSPYLFIFCVEGLSSLINSAVFKGLLAGFRCWRSGPNISHLFFTDDSLLFSNAISSECATIR
jgi:hypothetical protein